jgi:molybdenum cofactor biosynthesis enzyme MoaA
MTALTSIADQPVRGSQPLVDTFGRLHDNLRISVTDRCNVRCFYCMPEDNVKYAPRAEILSFEEIERFARVAVSLGVTKIRVTGGEPLVRKDLPVLVGKLCAIPGVRDIALTTNGVLLARHAQALYDAGLRRLNVHLDTLDRERFRKITRRDDLDKVLEGIDTAQRIGFGRIKIWWNRTLFRWCNMGASVASKSVSSSSCRWIRKGCGRARTCCRRTKSSRRCRAKSRRW